jgi:hypothetical protein
MQGEDYSAASSDASPPIFVKRECSGRYQSILPGPMRRLFSSSSHSLSSFGVFSGVSR